MSMQDQTSDMFTRIRNALSAHKKSTVVHKSKFNLAILQLLIKEGYLSHLEEDKLSAGKRIIVTLKYFKGQPVIEMIKSISKPSRRVHVKSKDVKNVYRGLGISVISTSKGLMTDREARFQKLGGEIICQVF